MSWRTLRRALPLLAVTVSLAASQQVAAYSLLPPSGKVYLGVSDRGQKTGTAEFELFAKRTAKHPAVLQTFLKWGERLTTPGKIEKPYERWRKTKTRPMLHI